MNTKPDIYADNPVVTLEYMIAVMQAAKDGHPVQARNRVQGGVLQFFAPANMLPSISWNWTQWEFRIAPNSRPKKTVPMERDDYPPFFWLREKANPDSVHLCTGIVGGWLKTVENLPSFDKNWLSIYAAAALNVADPRPCEYSTDRKTWKPCTKEVVA